MVIVRYLLSSSPDRITVDIQGRIMVDRCSKATWWCTGWVVCHGTIINSNKWTWRVWWWMSTVWAVWVAATNQTRSTWDHRPCRIAPLTICQWDREWINSWTFPLKCACLGVHNHAACLVRIAWATINRCRLSYHRICRVMITTRSRTKFQCMIPSGIAPWFELPTLAQTIPRRSRRWYPPATTMVSEKVADPQRPPFPPSFTKSWPNPHTMNTSHGFHMAVHGVCSSQKVWRMISSPNTFAAIAWRRSCVRSTVGASNGLRKVPISMRTTTRCSFVVCHTCATRCDDPCGAIPAYREIWASIPISTRLACLLPYLQFRKWMIENASRPRIPFRHWRRLTLREAPVWCLVMIPLAGRTDRQLSKTTRYLMDRRKRFHAPRTMTIKRMIVALWLPALPWTLHPILPLPIDQSRVTHRLRFSTTTGHWNVHRRGTV